MSNKNESNISEFEKMKKVIISCVAGSALEWYDFAIYGCFAVTIGKLFFPSTDAFQQIIYSFGAFASGLIARPIGAVMFGYIGDVFGRKKALVISIYMMAVPTAAMGLLPTYEYMGMWAGIVLTLIRILQGLALGGGFTGTIVFLYEHSREDKKATYSCWAPFSLVSGFVLGSIVAMLMSFICNDQQLEVWGWRIPFIISAFGTLVAEYVKNKLDDPKEFLDSQKEEAAIPQKQGLLKKLFKNHWKGLVMITLTDVLTACGYFLLSVFFITYLETVLDFGKRNALIIQTINMICFAVFLILCGQWADKFGRRRQMLAATIAMMILAYPIFVLISSGIFWKAMLGQLAIIFIFSVYYAPIPAAICSMLPTKVRLAGVSIAHNFAMAAFGAFASTWAMQLIKITGSKTIPALLFIVTAGITAVALYVWKEGKDY
ncbi:MAG: MFS transporter [Holosporaceae bacterium]|jgi:MHS family proline/betaine transporter-like MFS transporter|nr:MFS transporter [Holosporaceae bacterium]